MCEAEELEYNKKRDEAYTNAAMTVWAPPANGFGTRYRNLQETGLYEGTSFQRRFYPEQYAAHIESLKKESSKLS